jgi:hypothetical protein
VRKIIDSFGPVLTQHLTDEIQTLLAFEKFPDPKLRKAYMHFDEEARKGDPVFHLTPPSSPTGPYTSHLFIFYIHSIFGWS